MKKNNVKNILSIFLMGTLLSTASGCYFFPDEEPILEPPTLDVSDVVYNTYTSVRKDIVEQTIQSGYVISNTETECYFTQYTGQLKNIYVNPGDFVEEGDLLAEFNNGAIEYTLEIQKKKVELAQLNYNNSGSAADRLQLEIEQNTLAQYQAEYDGGHIFAPVSGQVSFVKTLSPGDEVNPYDVIVRIVDPDDLCVSISTTSITDYYVDDAVTVSVNGENYDGVVLRTPREEIEEGDETADSVFVGFVDDSPGFGCLGTIASVTKIKSISENAVVIPKHIVRKDGERTYVQVLRDDVKVEVDIVTGIENATEIEVISGLEEGEKVIVK